MPKKSFFLLIVLFSFSLHAQTFTRADSLQGSLRHERTAYDVLRYDLTIAVHPKERKIIGHNKITFKVVEKEVSTIQIDLFENMKIDSIVWEDNSLFYKREFNAVFVDFPQVLVNGDTHELTFYYSGKPQMARRPPWDGGFVWSKDSNDKDWIGVAVQGTGASLWYPVKDHQTDEPDNGATITIIAPNGLMGVSNGRLIETIKADQTTAWKWEVKNPINNYNITLNIGDYVHFGENYKGLDLNYYILKNNLSKAKSHFEEVKPMLDCFQSKFGKFPFWEDGYKLIETPYLGMEHQSGISYGNKYLKGYLGQDISDTGIGMLFDYITIHESGHEWFGNSITSEDIADMWIHEGFTTYTEGVFIECQYGYDQSVKYMNGKKINVLNKTPIVGQFGVNFKASNSDMYGKGALFLHTLRNVINNDDLWWNLLLDFAQTYRHHIVNTNMVLDFFDQKTGLDLEPIFKQYLFHPDVPTLELKIKRGKVYYRWQSDIADFNMPIDVKFNNELTRWHPDNDWQQSNFKTKKLKDVKPMDDNFYIHIKRY